MTRRVEAARKRSCESESLLGSISPVHHSARVTREDLANADLVIAMDVENLNCVRQQFPVMANRTTLLGLFGTPETLAIADPYRADEATTNKIVEQVRQGIEGLAAWVEKRNPICLHVRHPHDSGWWSLKVLYLVSLKEILLQNGKCLAQKDEINFARLGQINGNLLIINVIQCDALAAHLPISQVVGLRS